MEAFEQTLSDEQFTAFAREVSGYNDLVAYHSPAAADQAAYIRRAWGFDVETTEPTHEELTAFALAPEQLSADRREQVEQYCEEHPEFAAIVAAIQTPDPRLSAAIRRGVRLAKR